MPLARVLVPERMDAADLDPSAHREALRGLARINALTNAAGALWPTLRDLGRRRPVRVLDLATGSGDVPLMLARRARSLRLPISFAGCDISETALTIAREHASTAGVRIDFFRQDLLRDGPPTGYDVQTCSLFLHHLREAEVVTLLRRMAATAAVGIVVSDLQRSRLGIAAAYLVTRLTSRSPIVHFDGPQSVRAAFTAAELSRLADYAGLRTARIIAKRPFRLLLTWVRS